MNEISNKSKQLAECQKEFLFNRRYEATEWSFGEKILRYTCGKSKISVYCDISDDTNANLTINDIYDIKKQILEEILNTCKNCKYRNQ